VFVQITILNPFHIKLLFPANAFVLLRINHLNKLHAFSKKKSFFEVSESMWFILGHSHIWWEMFEFKMAQ